MLHHRIFAFVCFGWQNGGVFDIDTMNAVLEHNANSHWNSFCSLINCFVQIQWTTFNIKNVCVSVLLFAWTCLSTEHLASSILFRFMSTTHHTNSFYVWYEQRNGAKSIALYGIQCSYAFEQTHIGANAGEMSIEKCHFDLYPTPISADIIRIVVI